MNLTLKQLIDKSDEIHLQFDNLEFDERSKLIKELHLLSNQLHSVLFKVSNIYNICNNKQKSITKNYIKKDELKDELNKDDWKCISRATPNKNLTDCIKINVKIVKDISEVPNTSLYWVENINQFAMQLNGVIFRGSVGNIYNLAHPASHSAQHSYQPTSQPTSQQLAKQTSICKYGNSCINILNGKPCNFYHDPLELISLLKTEKIKTETYNLYTSKQRNFINTSWIYTEFPHKETNKNMRHFGSKDILNHDFELMQLKSNVNEILNYRHQCIHDILVIMGLNQYGLIKD